MNAPGASFDILYRSGFKNPSADFPVPRRWPLRSVTMPAKAGDEAEVPSTPPSLHGHVWEFVPEG